MKRKHPGIIESKEVGGSIKNYLLKPQNSEEINEDGVRKRILKFIVLNNQPFTVIESIEFKDLINYVSNNNQKCKTVSADTVRRDLKTNYENEKSKRKAYFAKLSSKITFILDCWTSSNQFAFLGIVAQWIDDDWNLNTGIFDFIIMEGSHTGKNLASVVFDSFKEYGVLSKISAIVSDNAGNMDTFFEQFEVKMRQEGIPFDCENQRIRCLAHIVNLVVKASLKSVEETEKNEKKALDPELMVTVSTNPTDSEESEVDSSSESNKTKKKKPKSTIEKLRTGVRKVRASTGKREDYRGQCQVAGLKNNQLILDVETRWNSTLDMLIRAKEMQIPFEWTLQMDRSLRKWILTEAEWTKIKKLIEFLTPFKTASDRLSQNDASLSRCVSTYQFLFKHLEKYIVDPTRGLKGFDKTSGESYPTYLQIAAKSGWEKIKKYYPSSDGFAYVGGTGELLVILASIFNLMVLVWLTSFCFLVLDPRCKLAWYKITGWPKSWIEDCKRKVKNKWETVYKPQVNMGSVEGDSSPVDDFFYDQLKKLVSKDSKDELQRFLGESSANLDSVNKIGLLGWWKVKFRTVMFYSIYM